MTDFTHIDLLIARALDGSVTPAELAQLSEWMEDPENEAYFYEAKKAWHTTHDLFPDNEEQKKALRHYVQYIRSTGKRKNSLIRTIVRVAAIVIPLLGVGAVYYILQNRFDSPIGERVVTIEPGRVKAELILADGSMILLGEEPVGSLTLPMPSVASFDEKSISYNDGAMHDKEEFNVLRIPRGGEFTVRLSDGTVVRLNSESEFYYPVQFMGNERRVSLTGEAYFDVAHNVEVPFIIESNEATIRVLGTGFNLRSYPDEEITVTTLVSGRVDIESKDHKKIELYPGEQGIVDKEGVMLKQDVDTYLYTAWIDGKFIFRNQPLEEVMQVISRWYDVDVVFEDPVLKDITFTGRMERFEGFEFIVSVLEMPGDISFEIDDKLIIIKKRE